MSTEESWTEYHVEIPGKGFYNDYFGYNGGLIQNPIDGTTDREDAEKLLANGRGVYERMGCPEVAETLRIVSRTVTLIKTDWAVPVDIRKRETV